MTLRMRVTVQVWVPRMNDSEYFDDEYLTALQAARRHLPDRDFRWDAEKNDGTEICFTLTEVTE